MSSRPPFEFQGVRACVYPLRANIARLSYFIDQYLNLAMPAEIVRFRPALPFVYLMAMNYGRMAVTARNMGWVSQNEVAFVVPLERHQLIDRDCYCCCRSSVMAPSVPLGPWNNARTCRSYSASSV